MTSKATQEYRSSFITLISQLSEIEQKGQEFFDKMYAHRVEEQHKKMMGWLTDICWEN